MCVFDGDGPFTMLKVGLKNDSKCSFLADIFFKLRKSQKINKRVGGNNHVGRENSQN